MVIAVTSHKLAYMALPKAACTSVKEALARLDPSVLIPREDRIDAQTWHLIYPTRRFRAHRWNALSDHWRFCVVHDPARRLMSVYTNRVVHFRDLHNSRKLRFGTSALPTDPDPDTFFRNLAAYAHESSSIKHHAAGAWLFLGPELEGYDRIYRTEELADLAWDLSLLTRQKVQIPHRNRSEERLGLEDLAGETIDAIRPFLEREYDYMGRFFQNPLGPKIYDACVTPTGRVS
jgi:hypothetical protein